MFLLTEHVGQATFWNETPAFTLLDHLLSNSTDLDPIDYKNVREMQQQV